MTHRRSLFKFVWKFSCLENSLKIRSVFRTAFRMHLKNPRPHQMDVAFLIYQNPEINFGDVSRSSRIYREFRYDIVSPMNPPFPDVPVLYGGQSADFTAKFQPFKPIYNKYLALNLKRAR